MRLRSVVLLGLLSFASGLQAQTDGTLQAVRVMSARSGVVGYFDVVLPGAKSVGGRRIDTPRAFTSDTVSLSVVPTATGVSLTITNHEKGLPIQVLWPDSVYVGAEGDTRGIPGEPSIIPAAARLTHSVSLGPDERAVYRLHLRFIRNGEVEIYELFFGDSRPELFGRAAKR